MNGFLRPAAIAAVLVASALGTGTAPAYAEDGCRDGACGGDGGFYGSMVTNTSGSKVYEGSSGTSQYQWKLRPISKGPDNYPTSCSDPNGYDPNAPDFEPLKEVVYFGPGMDEWERAGYYCEEEGELVSSEDIGEQLESQWADHLPKLDPKMQPDGGLALANMPAYFDTGQDPDKVLPKYVKRGIPVFDFTIDLSAKPTWEWNFEGTGWETISVPKSTYRDKGPLQHTYDKLGPYRPSVRASWQGEFTLNGGGPYAIETPATQPAVELPIEVVEKVSRLGG